MVTATALPKTPKTIDLAIMEAVSRRNRFVVLDPVSALTSALRRLASPRNAKH